MRESERLITREDEAMELKEELPMLVSLPERVMGRMRGKEFAL